MTEEPGNDLPPAGLMGSPGRAPHSRLKNKLYSYAAGDYTYAAAAAYAYAPAAYALQMLQQRK